MKKCPIEVTFSLINGKWKHRIAKELSQGPVRYGRLAREIPEISSKVLTQQLKELEADGLVARTIFAEVPLRVEYSLTAMGTSIFSVFKELRRWGLEEDLNQRSECSFCNKCRPVYLDRDEVDRGGAKAAGECTACGESC